MTSSGSASDLGRFFEGAARALAARLPPAGRILDLGAGSGVWSLAMAEAGRLAGLDGRATAVDVPEVLPSFHARAAAAGLADHVEATGGDFHEAPLPDAHFDRVLLANVLHLEPEARAARLVDAPPGHARRAARWSSSTCSRSARAVRSRTPRTSSTWRCAPARGGRTPRRRSRPGSKAPGSSQPIRSRSRRALSASAPSSRASRRADADGLRRPALRVLGAPVRPVITCRRSRRRRGARTTAAARRDRASARSRS
ncbi:MAG: class I SAM-dependent methyltransferase, partial [Myxococcales bacterium]|nr:class I SAM-dependent methyltransferase [Myxococcales bacterium]